MEDESISTCVDKFVRSGISLNEIKIVATLVSDDDFISRYELTEQLKAIISQEGRKDLKTELASLIKEEKQAVKSARIVQFRNYRLHAAAVLILIGCAIGVYNSTSGYNDVKHFRKTYFQK